MRIAYGVHHLPPRYTGGAEIRALRTARWMQRQGHEVAVACFEPCESDAPYLDSRDEGLWIRRLNLNWHFGNRRLLWIFDEPSVEEAFLDFFASFRPDVFHLIGGYLVGAAGARAATSTGIPIVLTLTDFWFMCPRLTLLRSDGTLCPGPPPDPLGCVRCVAEESRRFRLPVQVSSSTMDFLWPRVGRHWPSLAKKVQLISRRRDALSSVLATANALICPSSFLETQLLASGLARGRTIVMRQGLTLPTSGQSVVPSADVFTIGFVGQIKPHKGLDILLAAAKILRSRGLSFRVFAYGNVDEEPKYSSELRRRFGADWLHWRGQFTAETATSVLGNLDVLVVPSRWYENSPNVILEAQASHIPVIATRLGGMAELIRHDVDGLLFGVNDSVDLADQLTKLITDPALRSRLAANAPVTRSLDQEMTELTGLYRRVVEEGSAASDTPRVQSEGTLNK